MRADSTQSLYKCAGARMEFYGLMGVARGGNKQRGRMQMGGPQTRYIHYFSEASAPHTYQNCYLV